MKGLLSLLCHFLLLLRASSWIQKPVKLVPSIAVSLGLLITPVLNPLLTNSPAAHLIQPAFSMPEGVNRPDLLPKEKNVELIDVANFLTKGQRNKLKLTIQNLEKETGFKLRVLCQSYPNTPGLAIKEYWNVDDKTIVLVFDKGEGFKRKGYSNIINLNLGKNVEDILPNQFWTRLSNKLGNQPYVSKVGIDIAIINTVEAISYCLSNNNCNDLPFSIN